ncbi:MAG: hypothetical protein HYV26_12775 [Candidatus Hydrogenedentes bacterium]|nr:hypothetical protein [Candidatus Hydrogenedentota bacterium]
MKSAYELAMERLEKTSGPTRKLSDAQKQAIAAIDQKCEAKLAEVRLSFDAKINSAKTVDELNAARAELAVEVQRLEDKREQEKNGVWAQSQDER